MRANPASLERRSTQRFPFQLPVFVRRQNTQELGWGLTQDLCAGGALFYTDLVLAVGNLVELDLAMPAEISLCEQSKVRCRGHVLRVIPPSVGTKSGIAVHIEKYDFLPETEQAVGRIAALHRKAENRDTEAGMCANIFQGRGASQP